MGLKLARFAILGFCMRRLLSVLMFSLSGAAALAQAPAVQPAAEDPYLWLEDVSGDRALAWVRERNAAAEREFADDPRYEPLRGELLTILDSEARIPLVMRMDRHLYNFWRDAANPRGLWRRTTLDEYRKLRPAWEAVLDLDELARRESENWVWQGVECLRPDAPRRPYERCLVRLSRGGADAAVVREFDLDTRQFVDDGFTLPEAKQSVGWKDRDHLWVGSDFGPGSTTTSGYPRIVKEWRRGTPLSAARTVYEGEATDVSVAAWSEHESGTRRDWVRRGIEYWNAEFRVVVDGTLQRLDLPGDAMPRSFREWLIVRTRSAWTTPARTYPAGALLAIRFERFLRGERNFEVIYEPTPRSTLAAIATTRNALVLTELDNVRSRAWELRHDGRAWRRTRVAVPENAQVLIEAADWASDEYFLTVQDFTTPTALLRRLAGSKFNESLKSLPPFFEARGLVTQQFEATSRDGTRVPYFIVMRQGTAFDGRNPTLLNGYGGFAINRLPSYSGNIGKGWLERGGIFVLANLRGGGELGPQWHTEARKEHKQRTWDDMIAVAEDLIARGITRPAQLGIMGGSQGGLLVTSVMTQQPELFGAVVAQVPLVDMLRYHLLPAGASWIGEYGDPDKLDERAFIAQYSPYQNVRKDRKYPRIFLYTSTRDDRVHPGHARKMAARMTEQGHEVLYFENIEGGHGAAANNAQAARMWAQTFSFLWRQLRPAAP